MISALTPGFLLGMPLVGAVIAIAAALYSYESANESGSAPAHSNLSPGRLIVFLILPVFLVMLSLPLWMLVQGKARYDIESSIVEAAAMAYGVPSLLAGIGMAIVMAKGIGKAIQDGKLFARVLVYVVRPLTPALFGLVIFFMILGLIPSVPPGFIPSPISGTEDVPAWNAAFYISIGGIAAPLTAILSAFPNRAWEPRGMGRAVVLGAIGESVCIVFLVLAFFAVNA